MAGPTTAAIMQPGYLPWLGFIDLLWQSDVFVVLDNVQYDRDGWRNRNRIKTSNGIAWLTVPVSLPGGLETRINQVKIARDGKWQKKHLETIRQNYSKAEFFDEYFPPICETIQRNYEYLVELDMAFVEKLCELLTIKRKIVYASLLDVEVDNKIERLIEITKAVGCNRFYEPAGGKGYIGESEINRFSARGFVLEFQDYRHPAYRQLHGEFVPYLSVVDLLLNDGPRSLDIILEGSSTSQDEKEDR